MLQGRKPHWEGKLIVPWISTWCLGLCIVLPTLDKLNFVDSAPKLKMRRKHGCLRLAVSRPVPTATSIFSARKAATACFAPTVRRTFAGSASSSQATRTKADFRSKWRGFQRSSNHDAFCAAELFPVLVVCFALSCFVILKWSSMCNWCTDMHIGWICSAKTNARFGAVNVL